MLKKSFLLLFIFIYCGNSETLEANTNTIITDDALNSVSSNSSMDTTTTTLFNQFPVSSILKLSPTGDDTTTTVPQRIIGETTTTTVPQTTTTTVLQTTTTIVPQTTTTTVPQTTTTVPQTTTTVPQNTTTTVPQTTTTTIPQTTTTTTTTIPQTTTTTTTTTVPQTTINIGVTVGNNGSGSNVYFLNGSQDTTINVTTGNKYRFDLSDSSNTNHPLRFSMTQNGGEYNSNVTVNGVAGTTGAYVEIEITSNTPNQLYIYCTNHFNMGGNTVITKS